MCCLRCSLFDENEMAFLVRELKDLFDISDEVKVNASWERRHDKKTSWVKKLCMRNTRILISSEYDDRNYKPVPMQATSIMPCDGASEDQHGNRIASFQSIDEGAHLIIIRDRNGCF